MSKNICNIILDLLPEYIENDVSEDTVEFIEQHIKGCDNCKNILDNMSSNIIKEEEKLKNDAKKEFEKVKKVQKNLKKHKITLVISSVVISIITLILLFSSIYNICHKTLYDKILGVYEKNIKLDNCYVQETIIDKSNNSDSTFNYTSDTYVKNGRYKCCEYWSTDESITKDVPQYVEYGEIKGDKFICLNIANKEIYETQSSTYVLRGRYISYLEKFKQIDYKNVEIRTFQEKEWYVYKIGDERNYEEYWINKDNLTDMRFIEFDISNYKETSFTIKKDIVTDQNLNIDYDTTGFIHSDIL